MTKPMEWSFPLGKPFECGCGRTHKLELRELLIGEGVLADLPALVKRVGLAGKGLIFADPNTWTAAGEQAESLMHRAGLPVVAHIFRRDHALHPDDEAFAEGRQVIAKVRPDHLISVGSGSLTDLTKFLATEAQMPYLSVASAPSMDGYGSPGAAILQGGLKKTIPCGSAHAVLADYAILRDAPAIMLSSGFGDLMGKYTCNSDWLLAARVAGEYRCEPAWHAIRASLGPCLDGALDGTLRSGKALETLTQGLIDSGLSMLMAQTTRAAGGSEHLCSHFWEMRALHAGKEPDTHGRMVGVGTMAMVEIYKLALSLDRGFISKAAHGPMPSEVNVTDEKVREIYGGLADGVIPECRSKWLTEEKWKERLLTAAALWPELRNEMAQIMAPTKDLKRAFEAVGAPTKPSEVGLTPDDVREALGYARCLRRRYTMLDLLAELGVLQETVEKVVASFPG